MSKNPSTEASLRRVVVTGVGVCAPGAVGRESAWNSALEGATPEPQDLFPGHPCLRIEGFDAKKVVDKRKSLKLMGDNTRFAVGASREAWEASGREPRHPDGAEAGIVLGARTRPTDFSEYLAVTRGSRGEDGDFSSLRFGAEGSDAIFPLSMLRSLPNLVTAQVTIQLGLHGFSDSLTSGDLSGLQAVGEGFRVLCRGDAEVLLAGGADDLLDPVSLGRLLAHPDPGDRSLPISQGAAMVVLEEAEAARARGAEVLGEVLAVAEGFAPELDAETLAWTWQECLRRAGREGAPVASIHVDSTLWRRPEILEAARSAWGDPAPEILSEAPRRGCCGAASGSLEAVMALLALQKGTLPGVSRALGPDALLLASAASRQGGVVSLLMGAGVPA